MDSQKLIAVVDDEADVLFVVSQILKKKGYRVITGKGATDMKTIIQKNPDLILMDIDMPGKSGLEICRELKSKIATSNIPVILISASSNIQEQYTVCHADNYLQKPFGTIELINTIRKAV